MEYTIKKLSDLAGVSTRTLRYYDEIGLLTPSRINSSGYRIYGRVEVDRLQQIMFYREMGMELEGIKLILDDPDFDSVGALKEHRSRLVEKKERLLMLIRNVDQTLEDKGGGATMSDREKFEGFKKRLVDINEKEYGKEIREKYGDESIDASNQQLLSMDKETYEETKHLEEQMIALLKIAHEKGDATGEEAQEAAQLHKEWITRQWGHYNREAHKGLVQMYVDDERFRSYYDKYQNGMAEFLRDAVGHYMKNEGK
ncbi:MerR family transcriptional regulator [Rossellomorea marisflavi]|uniref:MerR family transcriptional regulator n=1 Tax=Rossellomorea marisflavi TaxID=189381 RepID=A0A0J5SIE8_9BACI|nr:MerR family transcriptional regulator [Rossellomorea marisflavi]KMK94726.1 MerR family transcriptional regulator [Rossellomorea marisflavi]KON84510.1 MerR family transcriptional regulator [Rossellomorea marisflavi]MCM2605277.1 MerR family transcriptional regulator [Rossellomorea marisflavi]QHA35564.1 MerR family transcriptional regulator [Rossellomorea marisflavi]